MGEAFEDLLAGLVFSGELTIWVPARKSRVHDSYYQTSTYH
jgi:hypothetical protein